MGEQVRYVRLAVVLAAHLHCGTAVEQCEQSHSAPSPHQRRSRAKLSVVVLAEEVVQLC